MDHMECARALREDRTTHYNCCQSVLVAFAKELGLSREQANALGRHFGAGMKHGSTCGALTGALMALGLKGHDEAAAQKLMQDFRARNGCLDCAHLLQNAKERGEERKAHCDRMVYECVEALDEALAR